MSTTPQNIAEGPPITLAAMERSRRRMADPNDYCDGCSRSNPKQDRDSDGWHRISGPMVSSGVSGEEWMALETPAAFYARGLTFGRGDIMGALLCPTCLPPMSELTFDEQRALFSPQFGAFHRATPWGPVRPGVPLPCPAERHTKRGIASRCEKEQGHGGYHTGGARYAHLYCDDESPANPTSPNPAHVGHDRKAIAP